MSGTSFSLRKNRNTLTIAAVAAGLCASIAVALISHATGAKQAGLIQVVPAFFLAGRVPHQRSLATYPFYWVNPWNADYYSGIANAQGYLSDRAYNMGSYAATANFNSQQYADMAGYNGVSFTATNKYNGDSFNNNNKYNGDSFKNNNEFNGDSFANNNEFDSHGLKNNAAYNKGEYENNADFNKEQQEANDAFNKKGQKKTSQKGQKKSKKALRHVQEKGDKVARHQQQLALNAKQEQWLGSRPDFEHKNSPSDGWLDYNPHSAYWGYDHHLNKNPTGGSPQYVEVDHNPQGGADIIGPVQAPFHPHKVDIEVPPSFQVDEYPRSVSGTHFN